MNREIKFRAYNKIDNSMSYATLDELISNVSFDYGVPEGVRGFMDNGVHEKPVIMQFTGLVDKHGKEIYEGDICRNCYGDIIEIVDGEHKYKVKFNELLWCCYSEDELKLVTSKIEGE